MVLADLHTHSNVSDGTTSPAEVVRRAAQLGLDVVALTDHDTAVGWDEAAVAAEEFRICLIRGMEISTKYEHRSVHLLAYLPDPGYGPLADELGRILAGRDDRLPAMLDQLAAAGQQLTHDDVHRLVGVNGVVGRPHVADAMVARGYARDRADAFERWLNPGRAGFVVRYAPRTPDMVQLVVASGGVPVIAHPWARSSREVLTADTLGVFRDLGLAGIEVDHQDHPAADREQLRRLAADMGLIATGSSDYHGSGKLDHELGCNLTPAGELDRLLEAAAVNAAASGRPVPGLVGGSAARLAR